MIFEWVKTIGTILISWPVVGLIAILLFRKPLLALADRFTGEDVRRAKFGPVEFERVINEVKETQRAQSDEIELVQLVSFAGIVSKHEIKHLYKLADKEGSYDVTHSGDLQRELKRLDDFGFIFPNEGKGLDTIDKRFGADIHKYEAQEKTKFNLKDYVHITNYGEKYIELANKLGLPERP